MLTHSAPTWPVGRKLGWCDRFVKERIARRVLSDGRHLRLCTSCVSSRKRSTRGLGGSCLFSIIAKANAPRKLGLRTMERGETGEATEVSEVRSESSGKPGEKRRRLGRSSKNPRAFSRTRRSDLVAREAPGLRSSEAKPQSWFHAHRVKALTATTGSDTRYGYTYVRMLDGRHRSVVSRSQSTSFRKRNDARRTSQKEIAELA